jgi:hypothetical protein
MQEILPSGTWTIQCIAMCTWWTVTRLRVIPLLAKCSDRVNYPPTFIQRQRIMPPGLLICRPGVWRRASASFIISRLDQGAWIVVLEFTGYQELRSRDTKNYNRVFKKICPWIIVILLLLVLLFCVFILLAGCLHLPNKEYIAGDVFIFSRLVVLNIFAAVVTLRLEKPQKSIVHLLNASLAF